MSQNPSESELAREELKKARRMQAVGRLATGIAHDYNNKMQVVLGFAELILRRTTDDDIRSYVHEILVAAQQATKLTNQLMSFSRKLPMHPCVISLNDEVANLVSVLKKVLEEDVDLDFIPAEHHSVLIDPLEISQILVFLTMYVRQCIEGQGKILLEISSESLTLPDQPGCWTVLRFRDVDHLFADGPVPERKKLRAMSDDLVAVDDIVSRNRGLLSVAEVEDMRVIEVLLPCAEVQRPVPATDLQQSQSEESPTGGDSVLVVDDDKYILDIVRLLLSQAGYQVHTATGPEEALVEMQENGSDIDLLITDVVMPTMNGRELYNKISEQYPALPVMYISGHALSGFSDRGVLPDEIHFLQKPFTGKKLTDMVESILRAR